MTAKLSAKPETALVSKIKELVPGACKRYGLSYSKLLEYALGMQSASERWIRSRHDAIELVLNGRRMKRGRLRYRFENALELIARDLDIWEKKTMEV